jgi:tetratricopeptide (TPR) repeat protein
VRFLTLVVALAINALSIGAAVAQSANSGSVERISPDLKALYQKTSTAVTELDVTAIARACSKVVPDTKRSKADRDYAASLLAWALNRRGEIRSATAAKLVEEGQLSEADAVDEKALLDYKTAIEYAPSNWRIHHNLAISHAMKGQYKKAIEHFNVVIDLKSDYPNAYFNRAELYFELKQYSQAVRDYSKAIELAQTDPQFYNSRGHCRFMLESYDEAIEDYRKAVELGSDSSIYQTDLADALQFQGQWEEAASVYRDAVGLNSRYARAYMNAAWLMATCPDKKYRNLDLALSAAKKGLELEGEPTVRGLDTLATAYAANGKMAEAVKYERQALQLAAADEREEVKQRLALFERGQAYVQSTASGQLPQQEIKAKPEVRTASELGSSRKAR